MAETHELLTETIAPASTLELDLPNGTAASASSRFPQNTAAAGEIEPTLESWSKLPLQPAALDGPDGQTAFYDMRPPTARSTRLVRRAPRHRMIMLAVVAAVILLASLCFWFERAHAAKFIGEVVLSIAGGKGR